MVLHAIHPSTDDSKNYTFHVDIVLVHGLNEDHTRAWTDSSSGILWLRDLLPRDTLDARILTSGYQADTVAFFGSRSTDRILHHAHTLVAELEADRAIENASERPIIFVCHGLGGIVVKKALAYSAGRTSQKVEHLHSIFVSTYAILFFGTPHEGIEKTSWPLMAQNHHNGNVNTVSSELLSPVAKSSEMLQNINDEFTPLMKQFCIYFFWEELQTSLESMTGFVVSEGSAAPILDNTERSGISATHSEMCKFKSVQAPGYRTVIAALRRYSRDAEALIRRRWQESRKSLATQRSNEASELVQNGVRDYITPHGHKHEPVGKPQNKYFHIPHNVSSIYTGREDIIQGLENKLLLSSVTDLKHQQKRFVLYGLGGSGKTQFCLKFVQDYRDRFWGVFWVDASTVENAERAFSDIGRLGGLDETCGAGMYWLTGLEMPWLLIIDNADDSSVDYSRFFPPGERGNILVTSRNPDCRIHATIGYHEFKDMEHKDAITLFLRAADVKDPMDQHSRSLAYPIVKELGALPLALIQAGASIRQGICPLEEYLKVYATHKRQMMSTQPVQGADQYKYTIYTTWEVSFQMLDRQATELSADAIQILQVLAFLHFEQVPASIFKRAWSGLRDSTINSRRNPWLSKLSWSFPFSQFFINMLTKSYMLYPKDNDPILPNIIRYDSREWDTYRFGQAVAILSSFSLIFKDIATDNYSMHPMVHFWARDRLNKEAQISCSSIAKTILAQSIQPRFQKSDHAFRRSLVPHMDACLYGEHTTPLLQDRRDDQQLEKAIKFAAIYSESGRWVDAATLQEQILSARVRTLTSTHPKTLEAMSDLAWSYWNLSRIPKALELQLEVTKLSTGTLGINDPMTLKAMDNLAHTYWLCGDRQKAKELGITASEGMRSVLGEGHPDTLTAMHNLGQTYMHLGCPEMSKELQIEVLGARAKLLGSDHPDTLMTMASLGISYSALGQQAEAKKLLLAVVETRKRILGQEHAYTLWAINDLSKIYCEQGDPLQAEQLLHDVLDIAIRTLGKDHIGTLMTQFNLAHAYGGQGRWTAAQETLIELTERQARVLGPLHPDTLIATSELALAHRHQDHFDDAERLYIEVIEPMARSMGPEHSHTLHAVGNLAQLYRDQGRETDAKDLESRKFEGGI